MKKRILAMLFWGALLSPTFSHAETLNNNSVITLTQAGLGNAAIIAKIQSSTANFDLSTDQLIALKRARVTDDVIAAMLQASTQTTVSATAAVGANNMADPRTPRPSGIYVQMVTDSEQRLSRLDPTTAAENKSTGRLASALTYGLARVRAKTVLPTPTARVQVRSNKPVFYFYFDQTSTSLSQNNAAAGPFGALMGQPQAPVTSPNEFTLVKLTVVGTSREIETASANILGSSSGTASGQRIDFTYEDVAPGIYRVTPRSDLLPGEYGFVYASGGASAMMQVYGGMSGGSKVFDFGVAVP